MTSPGSSAASYASQHTCARHPALIAPRFCTDCGDRLCTACSRYRAHKTCPSCNVAAGRAPLKADVGWYAMLYIDGVVQSFSRLKTRILPFSIFAALLGTAAVVGIVSLVGNDAAEDADQMFMLVGIANLGALACLWLQPGLSLPVASPLPFWRQAARALVGGVLPLAVGSLTLGLSFGLIGFGEVTDTPLWAALGVVLGLLLFFPALLLSSLALPIQAAYAVGGRSLLGALKAPFAGGVVPVVMMVVLWMAFLSVAYSSLYAAMLPVVIVALLAPWAGAFVGVVMALVGLAFLLLLSAAYATAGLRIAEDSARLRGGARESTARRP